MERYTRNDGVKINAPGRLIERIFGKLSASEVENANMGFAHFSEAEHGPMCPHYHEDEIIYVLEAKDAYTLYGQSKDALDGRMELNSGDVLRYHAGERHIFKFTKPDGYLDILFFFSVGTPHVVEEAVDEQA